MSNFPRFSVAAVALGLGVATLGLPGSASAATDPIAVATTTTIVPTSASTQLAGMSVSGAASNDVVQATVTTDLGTLTLPTTTGLTLSAGDSFTADPSISVRGTVSALNASFATATLNAGATTGTAHVRLSVLSSASDVSYNPATGHFYQLVTGNTSWTAARAAAAAKTFHGLAGYLATPATAPTNTFLANTYSSTPQLWIGGKATDAAVVLPGGILVNRTWSWVDGPYAGTPFTRCAQVTGLCVHVGDNGLYSNWGLVQPDNGLLGTENVASTNFVLAGQWSDEKDDTGAVGGYLVEYGDATSSTTAPTGVSSATGNVVVADVPAAPTGLTLAAGDQSATATFTAPANPAGAPVTGYTVVATPSSGPAVSGTCAGSPCTLGGLTNGTAYTVAIRAVNGAGTGASVSGSVTPAGKPGVPTGVSATGGDAQATVTYTAPTNTNGAPITGYTVTATPTGGGAATTKVCSAATTSCTVTGLTNGSSYALTVHATTSGGNSAEVSAGTVTPAGKPDAPTGVSATAGDAQATVSYTAPSNTNGAPVTGYTVTAVRVGGGTPLSATCGPATTSCTVTGLANGSQYALTVHATTSGGNSTEASAGTVTPVGKPASAPGGLTATAGDGKATLSFTPATASAAAPVTGYLATITPVGGTASSQPCSGPGCVVTGLVNGTQYSITVAATNASGSGPASGPATLTPAGKPSTAPGSLSATPGNGQATLNFTPVTSAPAVTGYTATITTQGGAATTRACAGPGCVITALSNGTTYSITLHATNAAGDGPESTPATVTPTADPSPAQPGEPGGSGTAASDWYVDQVSPAARAKEIPVPRAPKRYHAKKRHTVATYRSFDGRVVVPAALPAGRSLRAGQGVQLKMRALFKKSSTKLSKRGRAQLQSLAVSLRSAQAVTCEGYTDYSVARSKRLSSKRAAAVCRALTVAGASSATSSRGYGGRVPVVVGGKPGARKANDRVVVIVTGG